MSRSDLGYEFVAVLEPPGPRAWLGSVTPVPTARRDQRTTPELDIRLGRLRPGMEARIFTSSPSLRDDATCGTSTDSRSFVPRNSGRAVLTGSSAVAAWAQRSP